MAEKTLLDVNEAFIENATREELAVLLSSTIINAKECIIECAEKLDEAENLLKDLSKVYNYDFGKYGIKETAKCVKSSYTAINKEIVRLAAILEIIKQDTVKRLINSQFVEDYDKYGAAIIPDKNKPNN